MSKAKRLLRALMERGGSDLHLSCGNPPIMRIHGSLLQTDEPPLTPGDLDQILREIISPAQRTRLDAELDLDFIFDIESVGRFRGNAFLQQRGPSVVFRTIPIRLPSPDELGIPGVIQEFARLRSGLVLVTGPAGSGKSTTLAALIDVINQTRAEHVITIEDPIEFLHDSKKALVNQREVGIHATSFAAALRSALREDPDVILVGEMRDPETISIGLTAAETGHLVVGTLHTPSAAKAIDRIIDSFPAEQQAQARSMLAESLRGIVAQKLLRRRGGEGRALAAEVLLASPAVANLIREGKTFQIPSVMQTARKTGMVPMDQAIAELFEAGLVDWEEALGHADDKAAFAAKSFG